MHVGILKVLELLISCSRRGLNKDNLVMARHVIRSYSDLHVELEPVVARWRQLGEQLNVPDHILRTIEAYGGDSPEECITEVLTRWAEQKEHTWGILIDAIAATNMNVELVEQLREKYHGVCACVDVCVQISICTLYSTRY